MFSAPPRFSESCDHGLLRELRLHLEPLSTPPAHPVCTLSMFGDDPLEPFFPDDVEKQDAVFQYVIAEFYFRVRRENFFQEFFSSQQGQVGQIMSREVQEIKYIVEQMTSSRFLVILQHLKIRAPLIVHHNDLAIQNSLKSEFSQRVRNRSKLLA